MTKIIGITGGIGSGKSTLSKHLRGLGYKTHDSDRVVSNLYKKPTKEFLNFIKKCGLEAALKKKQISKAFIADKIFDNNSLKKKFEKHIHKEVAKSRESFIKKNTNKKNKVIIIDIPLLFENRLDSLFDLVVCIISSKAIRTKRVLGRKKFSKKIFNKIIKSQTTDKERKKRSHIIILNNKTKKDFILRAQKVLMESLK